MVLYSCITVVTASASAAAAAAAEGESSSGPWGLMNGAAGEGMWTPRAPGDGAGANGDGDATCSATLLGDGTSMLDGDLATTCQHHTHTHTHARLQLQQVT